MSTALEQGEIEAPPPPGGGAAKGSGPEPADGGRRLILGNVRSRILISFLILLVLSTAASLLVLREVLFSRIGGEVQEELTAQVEALRVLSEQNVDPRTGEPFEGDLEPIFNAFLHQERPPEGGALIAFTGGTRYRTAPAGSFEGEFSNLASIDEPTSGEVPGPNAPIRYVAVPVTGAQESGALVAAKPLDEDRDRVESAFRIAVGVSIVITLLASLFIWLAAGRAVQPLRALARTTRAITETDLTSRVLVQGEGEISDLGRTFNGMLNRLESAFANQKEFLADVGHELRTPITVIRGHLETVGDDPRERREATAVIHDELERMSRLVDDLLLLARSDRPDFLRAEPLDLDVLTNELFAKARTLGVRRWAIDEVGVGVIRGDPHRLTSAVMNLAQNAVRHTRGDEAIAIGSAHDGEAARIWVRDEGRGIPFDEQQRIFERFAGGAEPVSGHGVGLGLAIVKAIAEAHGGRVELESAPEQGACFTIVLPASEAERGGEHE